MDFRIQLRTPTRHLLEERVLSSGVAWSRSKLYEQLVHMAYCAVDRSHMLRTSLGRRFFIGGYFQYKRLLEDHYARLVRERPKLFSQGDILDVGANIGYTAALFAGALSNNYKIYAFEPEPSNLALLTDTIRRRGLQAKVIPFGMAIGAEEGSAELWISRLHPADHRVRTAAFEPQVRNQKTVTVPVTSLDRFVSDHGISQVSFVKIDVQGFEPAVCAGMEHTLASNPHAAVGIEYCPEAIQSLGFDSMDLLKWFRDRGYRASSIDTGKPIAEAPDLQPGAYMDLLFEQA